MTSQIDQNKALVRDYVENILNNHIVDRFGDYIHEDSVDHSAPANIPPGPAGTRMFFSMFFEGSSDAHNQINDLIAEGDRVTLISTVSGTHDGNLMGLPATGKKYSVQMLETIRIRDGKYAEHWGGIDIYKMMLQLGAVKDPDAEANAEKYKAMVYRYIEGVNNDDETALREVFAVDFDDHNAAAGQVAGMPQGVEAVVSAHHMLNQSFTDLKFVVDDIFVEGDQVGLLVTASGLNTGPFYGMPATNKVISWMGHRIMRVANGQFVEGWSEFDQVGILQQMGIIPSFAPPPNPGANTMAVKRLYGELSQGNFDIVDELVAPEFVAHGDALMPLLKGAEAFKMSAQMTKMAFPDVVITIENTVANGDKVMTRLRWTGTNANSFMGLPTTGKQMSWTALATNRFENGKIVEQWVNMDSFAFLQQLGMIPGGQ